MTPDDLVQRYHELHLEGEGPKQAAILFSALSRGRNADRLARVIADLARRGPVLDVVRAMTDEELVRSLTCVGIAPMLTRTAKALAQAYPDIDDFEDIKGIGPKLAAMCRVASGLPYEPILDTHMLRWLRSLGYSRVPKTTPSARSTYNAWALCLKKELITHFGEASARTDLMVWNQMRQAA